MLITVNIDNWFVSIGIILKTVFLKPKKNVLSHLSKICIKQQNDAQTFIHPYSSILLFSRKLKQLITPYYSTTLHITIQQMGTCGTTLNLRKALKIR